MGGWCLRIDQRNVIIRAVTVHGVYRSSTDKRDIPIPPHGEEGFENPAYGAFAVPVNGCVEFYQEV
jgi:hypothetical protein